MKYKLALTLTLLLSTPTAWAESTPVTINQTTVSEIQVTATDELLANLIKATLSIKEGASISSASLPAIEKEVLAIGYFSSVKAELINQNEKTILKIAAEPNKIIDEIKVEGMTFIPAEQFKEKIAELLNIAPGVMLNTVRVEEAKQALVKNYRQLGYPFEPEVITTVKTTEKGVSLHIEVKETAEIRQIEVSGATLIDQDKVNRIFKPLYDSKKFTAEGFNRVVQQVREAYIEQGYLQSGIDIREINLQDGVLSVSIIEGKASQIEFEELEVSDEIKSGLQTKVGAPIQLSKLREDVRYLSNKTGKPVGFDIRVDENNPLQTNIYFGSAQIETAPIQKIEIIGNKQLSSQQLTSSLNLREGDIYTPQLAQDDFVAIREAYRKAGYEISTRDAITFKEGVLTFNIREVEVLEYKIEWQGAHQTRDEVILRELPSTGLFNLSEIRQSLGNISRLGYINIAGEKIETPNPEVPEKIIYVLQVTEQKIGIPINLSMGYDTISGWNGELGYENNNVFGRGHHFNIRAAATNNQAGQNWSGGLSYTIPWLEFDFADFKQNRTSATVSLSSTVEGNATIFDKEKDTGRDYTQRTTSFGINVSRNIIPNLSASAGVSVNYRTYFLEPVHINDITSVSDDEATAFLSKTLLTTRIQTGLNYDKTDNYLFPGKGQRAYISAGYNRGRTGETPLSWADLQLGYTHYFGLGEPKKSTGTYENVIAARAHYGTYIGKHLPDAGYNIGGSHTNPASELRGLNDGQLFGTRYLTSSVEYRRDFGINHSIAQGLYGIVWADYGGVWKANQYTGAYGLGTGLQVNLGIGGAQLPTLRFDYGWSPQRADKNGVEQGGGKFMFRIGNFW